MKIWPYIEEQALYDQFDKTKTSNDPANAEVVAAPLPWLICPSDSEKLSPDGVDPPGQHNDGGSGVFNPKNSPVMSLWYPVSLGPTHMDNCPFCPPVAAGAPNYCCQGANFGSGPAPANDPTTPAGKAPVFRRLVRTVSQRNQALGDHGRHDPRVHGGRDDSVPLSLYLRHCPNFPFAGTNIPLNTFLKFPPAGGGSGFSVCNDPEDPECGGYSQACGYKSHHPGGAHMLMADGSTHFVSESIDFEVYYLLGTRKSGVN